MTRFYLNILMGALLATGGLSCEDDGDGLVAIDDVTQPDGGQDGGDATVTITYVLTGQVLDGFAFCLADDPDADCFVSNAEGVVELELPANSDVALSVTRDGFVPLLWQRRTTAEDEELTLGLAFTSAEAAAEAAEAAGVAPDETKGVILCLGLNAAGGHATLSPTSGEGPFYGEAGAVVPSLTEFRTAAVWFFNVEPGDYEVTFEHPDRECIVHAGLWRGPADNINLVRVDAGHQNWGCAASCTADDQAHTTTRDALADADACEDGMRDFLGGLPQEDDYPDCDACNCGNCLEELNACGAEPGCIDIAMCALAAETRCSGAGCAAADTCLEVLSGVPGGTTGAATMAATAWADCTTEKCPEDCSTAAVRAAQMD